MLLIDQNTQTRFDLVCFERHLASESILCLHCFVVDMYCNKNVDYEDDAKDDRGKKEELFALGSSFILFISENCLAFSETLFLMFTGLKLFRSTSLKLMLLNLEMIFLEPFTAICETR